MATRIVEGKKPYTGGEAINIDENKVISLKLRDENNLIIYDEGDDEIYVDLQLEDGIEPTDAFPVGVTTGRVLVADDWDKTGTLISAKTTSGDNIQLLYADDGTLWIDNGTGTFKQVYLSTEIATILADYATKDYVDAHDTVVSSSEPEDPYEGMLWYNTTSDKLKVYDGTAWQDIGSGGGSDIEYVTQAEYNALLPGALTDNKHYFIYSTSGGGGWQPTSPMCWYKFDGDMTDSTGTFGNASGTSSFQILSSGIQVLQTDGTNKVLLPSGVTQNAMTTYTIAFWMKAITTSPTYGYYMGCGGDYYGGMSFYESTAGRNYYEWTGGNTSSFNTRDITVSGLSTGWRLVALRSNGTGRNNVSLTINATDTISSGGADGTDSSSLFGWGEQFVIGARNSGATGSGQVTSVQISNFVISQTYWDDTTLLDMYDQTKADYGIS